jgi:hypothetical protein
LVQSTENVLKFETLGWIQNMQDTLEKLESQTEMPSHSKVRVSHPIEKEEITDGAYYGPTDIPDAAVSDGAYYGPTDVPDAAIPDGAYYGPADVPDAEGLIHEPYDDLEPKPVDLSPNDLQELDALLNSEEIDTDTKADFLFGGYPPDDEDIDVDDFLPGKPRKNN